MIGIIISICNRLYNRRSRPRNRWCTGRNNPQVTRNRPKRVRQKPIINNIITINSPLQILLLLLLNITVNTTIPHNSSNKAKKTKVTNTQFAITSDSPISLFSITKDCSFFEESKSHDRSRTGRENPELNPKKNIFWSWIGGFFFLYIYYFCL